MGKLCSLRAQIKPSGFGIWPAGKKYDDSRSMVLTKWNLPHFLLMADLLSLQAAVPEAQCCGTPAPGSECNSSKDTKVEYGPLHFRRMGVSCSRGARIAPHGF